MEESNNCISREGDENHRIKSCRFVSHDQAVSYRLQSSTISDAKSLPEAHHFNETVAILLLVYFCRPKFMSRWIFYRHSWGWSSTRSSSEDQMVHDTSLELLTSIGLFLKIQVWTVGDLSEVLAVIFRNFQGFQNWSRKERRSTIKDGIPNSPKSSIKIEPILEWVASSWKQNRAGRQNLILGNTVF